jgi:hypothetical protein
MSGVGEWWPATVAEGHLRDVLAGAGHAGGDGGDWRRKQIGQSLLTGVLSKSKTRDSFDPSAAESRIILPFSTCCGSQSRAPGVGQHAVMSAATVIIGWAGQSRVDHYRPGGFGRPVDRGRDAWSGWKGGFGVPDGGPVQPPTVSCTGTPKFLFPTSKRSAGLILHGPLLMRSGLAGLRLPSQSWRPA